VNLRYVVPALGFVALSATSASAQEIAKGVTLDGYVDTIFTAETNNTSKSNGNNAASTTDFSAEGVLMVGWAPTDRISGKIVTRSGDGFQTSANKGSDNLVVTEAYGSVKATDKLTVSSGKSTGPFGYYSQYATGINFVGSVLSTKLYTVNPVGAWAGYTVNDQFSATVMVADTYYGGNKANRPSSVSPGLDFVFNATPELSLNVELTLDPNGSPVAGTDGSAGDTYAGGFNAQFKKEALTAAGEIIYQVIENKGETNSKDQSNIAWAAFVTYALSGTPIPMAVTGQLSGYTFGKTFDYTNTAPVESESATKAQLVLLTNPLTVSQFGLNYELYYQTLDKGGSSKKVDSYGVAVEGLYVIP
jgi:hypothetical protein